MARYNVTQMRVIFPSGKVAEKNPDRLCTVYGVFHDDNGNKLSITSKEVTNADAMHSDTVIDVENGILVLPSGERGRKQTPSVSQSDINSKLSQLRKSAAK